MSSQTLVPPPSPSPCRLPGLVCCGLAWPRMARPVPGLELETWHNSLARRGRMKGKNRRVTGRLHMNRHGNGEGRGGVRGWRVKVNPPHPRVPHRPLPNWRADKGDEEGVQDDTGRWALGPLPPTDQEEGGRVGGWEINTHTHRQMHYANTLRLTCATAEGQKHSNAHTHTHTPADNHTHLSPFHLKTHKKHTLGPLLAWVSTLRTSASIFYHV